MKLGKWYTLDEFTLSQTAARKGIDNTPDNLVIEELKNLVQYILDPLRDITKSPITVSSGYRSLQLNKVVGGSSTSQHCYGQAADINCPAIGVDRLFALIKANNLPFDQLINEYGQWVHVSYGPRNRREVLIAKKTSRGTKYLPG